MYNAGLTQVLPHISAQMAPTLILTGTEDVNYPQYAGFLDRLHALNVRAELFTAEGVGHGGVNQAPWYDKAIMKVWEFLASTFAQETGRAPSTRPRFRLQ